MIAHVMLYNRYARLIVYSFGLQRATDYRKADLPSAFAEVSLLVLVGYIMLIGSTSHQRFT